MKKAIVKEALNYVKENKPREFFELFFNVFVFDGFENGMTYELSTTTNHNVRVDIYISEDIWKEDFNLFVNTFDIDEEVSNEINRPKLEENLPISTLLEDFTDYYEWLKDIARLIDGEDISKDDDEPKESTCEDTIMVLLFDKGHYKKNDIESKTDYEKYKMAVVDKRHCYVHTAEEYCDILNSFKPTETYVWTYIVLIPKAYVLT